MIRLSEKKMHTETYKSFMGWADSGRGVKRGEKAAGYVTVFDENGSETRLAVFGKSQTMKLSEAVTGRNSCWDGDMIYDSGQGVWLRQVCGPKRQDIQYPMSREGL